MLLLFQWGFYVRNWISKYFNLESCSGGFISGTTKVCCVCCLLLFTNALQYQHFFFWLAGWYSEKLRRFTSQPLMLQKLVVMIIIVCITLASKNIYCDHNSMMCFNEHENQNVHTPNILHQKIEDRKKDSGNSSNPDCMKKYSVLESFRNYKQQEELVCWFSALTLCYCWMVRFDRQPFHLLVCNQVFVFCYYLWSFL